MNLHVAMGRAWRLPAVLALVLGGWAASGPAARADNIDEGLYRRAYGIVQDLRKHGYKNIGVLKFQVQKDNDKPSFAVGRLNTMMATRLENALVRVMDERNPTGITRGASAVAAARDKKATYTTAAGRQKLLQGTYPLAWGDKSVTVDAFLTGLVQADFKAGQAKVLIQAFDKKSKDLRVVDQFTVNLDRTALTDMNLNYVVRRSANGTKGTNLAYVKNAKGKGPVVLRRGDQMPDDVIAGGDPEEPRPEPRPEPEGSPKDFDKLLQFRIFYDDKEVTKDAENQVPTPQKGQKVHFLVQSTERLGLVVRVNGLNTLRLERDRQPDEYSMWVLEPGKEYSINGYYPENTKVRPFSVAAVDEADKSDLGDEGKWGKIEIDVFTAKAEVERRRLALRGVTRRAATLKDLKKQILAAAETKPGRRNLIVPTKDLRDVDLQQVPFEGGLAVSQTITYYDRKR